jgi:hypothetical protein
VHRKHSDCIHQFEIIYCSEFRFAELTFDMRFIQEFACMEGIISDCSAPPCQLRTSIIPTTDKIRNSGKGSAVQSARYVPFSHSSHCNEADRGSSRSLEKRSTRV